MEFPMLVYRSASDHMQVQEESEYEAAMSDGWFASVPEAQAKMHASQFIEAGKKLEALDGPPTRQELETQARELNLKFDGRNSDASLLRMIDDALKA